MAVFFLKVKNNADYTSGFFLDNAESPNPSLLQDKGGNKKRPSHQGDGHRFAKAVCSSVKKENGLQNGPEQDIEAPGNDQATHADKHGF